MARVGRQAAVGGGGARAQRGQHTQDPPRAMGWGSTRSPRGSPRAPGASPPRTENNLFAEEAMLDQTTLLRLQDLCCGLRGFLHYLFFSKIRQCFLCLEPIGGARPSVRMWQEAASRPIRGAECLGHASHGRAEPQGHRSRPGPRPEAVIVQGTAPRPQSARGFNLPGGRGGAARACGRASRGGF